MDKHGGWAFATSSSGIRSEIIHALCEEWNIPQADSMRITLSPLTLLPHSKRFAFKAVCGARVLVGAAQVDVEVFQDKPGSEYASSFVRVFITE